MTRDPTIAVSRLVAIRRHALERMRQDAHSLDRLVQEAEQERNEAAALLEESVADIRRTESGALPLDAGAMMACRRYLAALEHAAQEKQAALDAVAERRDQARRSLNEAYTAVRALERVVERRVARAGEVTARRTYQQLDDLEVSRHGHGEHASG